MNPYPGLRIAKRFELQRPLGQGGMGSVWLARDLQGRGIVALKFMAQALVLDREMLARFQREVRVGETFVHPNIIRQLGHGALAEGCPYIVMEYLPGEDLSARITRTGALSLAETRQVVTQVCRALESIHRRGLVHRDIKPANILIEERCGRLTAKVADFGLVYEQDAAAVTQARSVVGTPLYMSPERLGDGCSEPQTDLWSVAAVAYHCLAGRPPFDGGSFGAVCIAVGKGKMRPMRRVRPSLPLSIDAWFARALNKKPGRRFTSADELERTFGAACEGAVPSEFELGVRRLLSPLARLYELAKTELAPVPAR